MVGAELHAHGAVGTGKPTAGPEDAKCLAKEAGLERGGWNVVEHGHGDCARKGIVGEGHGGTITFYNRDVRGLHSELEALREALIDFNRGEASGLLAKKIRGKPRARADLENVIAEYETSRYPRQDDCFQGQRPLRGSAKIMVVPVHARQHMTRGSLSHTAVSGTVFVRAGTTARFARAIPPSGKDGVPCGNTN